MPVRDTGRWQEYGGPGGHMEYVHGDDDPIVRVSPHAAPASRPAGPHKAPIQRTESLEIVELRRRHDGWTAARQRLFLNTLANTGSVGAAAEAADITPKSAYRLRNHPKGAAFRQAWDAALMTASQRLLAVAFERATSGTPRQIWREGRVIAEHSIPSDRMLMFLLRHLHPALFGPNGDAGARAAAIAQLQAAFVPAMATLVDTDVEADLLDVDDFRPKPPREEVA